MRSWVLAFEKFTDYELRGIYYKYAYTRFTQKLLRILVRYLLLLLFLFIRYFS